MKVTNDVLEMDRPRFIIDPSIFGHEEAAIASGIRVFPNKKGNYPVVETTLREWDARAGHEFIERVNDNKIYHDSSAVGGSTPKYYVKGNSLIKRESDADSGEIVSTFESYEAAAAALDEIQFKDAKLNGPLFFDRLSDAQIASNRYSDIAWSITEAIATSDSFASPWNRHMLHDDLARNGVTGAFIRYTTREAVAAHYDSDRALADEAALDGRSDFIQVFNDEMDQALRKTCVRKLLHTLVAEKWAKAKIQYEEEDDESDW